MENLVLALVVSVVLATSMPSSHGSTESHKEAISEWLHKISHAKQKATLLRFYVHDIVSGSHPTALRIAESKITNTSRTNFGALVMIDDPLTEGPEPTSKLVGRAQGFYGTAGMQEARLVMVFNMVFTSGKFNGSTLSILGSNPVFENSREFSIVGGTGNFRLARGFVLAKTYQFNVTTGDATVEYNVVAAHY